MNDEIKLDDCPFCGREATMNEGETSDRIPAWFVQCEGCGATSDLYAREEYAAEWWNKRFDPAAQPEA